MLGNVRDTCLCGHVTGSLQFRPILAFSPPRNPETGGVSTRYSALYAGYSDVPDTVAAYGYRRLYWPGKIHTHGAAYADGPERGVLQRGRLGRRCDAPLGQAAGLLVP